MRTTPECLEITNKYISDILDGTIPVCRLVKQTYQRHLDDLAKSETDEYEFKFNPTRGSQVIKFLELLQHVKGPLARKNFILEPWQIAMTFVLYGWVRKDDGLRRFTKAQLFFGRKQGKSFYAAGLALYHLVDPRDGGSEIYSASIKRDTARITFDTARQIVIGNPKFAKAFGLAYNNQRVYQEFSGSYFKSLSKDTHGQSTDGLNTSFLILDEVHLINNRALYDALTSSTGARTEPMLLAISTYGFDKTSLAYHMYEYGKKLLNGEHKDDSIFFLSYSLDPEDLGDPIRLLKDEELWKKANPNLGVSCFINDMRNLATQALNAPVERPNFFTKRLNLWMSSSTVYIPTEKLTKVQAPIDRELLRGQRCVMGIDGAARNDFMAVGYYFPATDDRKAVAFTDVYLNKASIADNVKFKQWAKEGLLLECGEKVTDFATVKQDILIGKDKYDIEAIHIDPYNLEDFSQQLKNEGLNCYKFYQTHRSYNIPMRELDSMITNEEIILEENPILSWMFENVVAHRDGNDLLMPKKTTALNKIDGVVAILEALGGFLRNLELAEDDNSKKWEDYSVRSISL